MSNKEHGGFVMELIAWIFAIGFSVAFFSNTKANIVYKTSDTYTLEYWTAGLLPNWFDFAFERTASQICDGEYSILAKTGREGDLKSPYTRWVISCDYKTYN